MGREGAPILVGRVCDQDEEGKTEGNDDNHDDDDDGDEEEDSVNRSLLQVKLEKMAMQIGYFGLAAGILTSVILYIRFGAEFGGSREWDDSTDISEIISIFMTGITVLIVAIPEGLPLAVTISLAYSMFKMMKEQNLVTQPRL